MTFKIVLCSDTHAMHGWFPLPEGDILVHAGDITRSGALDELEDFNAYLTTLPHRHKIVIAGNHDFCLEREPEARQVLTNCIYLQDQEVTVEGIRFYGSPWQPWFFDFAFNLQRGPEIKAKWDLIPAGIDVLITHGPPLGHGDMTVRGEAVGCADLFDAVQRVGPRLHVFGHIHEGYGTSEDGGTVFVNASICTLAYDPVNAPVVYDYKESGDQ